MLGIGGYHTPVLYVVFMIFISSRIYCVTSVENSKKQSNEILLIMMDILGLFGLQDSENVEIEKSI
jgi:hypothetical protein